MRRGTGAQVKDKQPKKVALKIGDTHMFSTTNIESCVAAGMTQYIRSDIHDKEIAALTVQLNAAENALVSQCKYCGSGMLHTDVVQYRHKYHGGRQI
jgi:hypothetical protein